MKKAMSLILAGALCLTLCTGALAVSGFSDVPDGKWYTAEIREMTAAGYIDGYEDGTFRPDGDVSVAEFVTIVARCLGLETGAENGHWAGRQMANAYDKGWLDEQDARRTEFNEPVSRQLAAKILASALGLGQGGSGDIPYKDAADVGQSYVGWVGAVCAAGLIEGFEDNTFRPGKILSRAEAATLITAPPTPGTG
ncbi:MAG: S-layer homology domain-containing protein [Oscillospiraceae bacterium]